MTMDSLRGLVGWMMKTVLIAGLSVFPARTRNGEVSNG